MPPAATHPLPLAATHPLPLAATHPLPLAAPHPLPCGHFRVALQAYRRLPSFHNDSYLSPCSKQSFLSTERSFDLFPCSDSVFLSTQFRVSCAVLRFPRSSAFPAQFCVSRAVPRFLRSSAFPAQFRVSRAVPRFLRNSAFPAQLRVSCAVLRFPRRRNGEGLMFLLRERKCALKGFGSAHEESVRAGVPPVHQGAVREGIWPWRATSLALRGPIREHGTG